MNNSKSKTRQRSTRLRLPKRLVGHLPKIHWALVTLRQAYNQPDFKWVHVGKDEPRAMPFFDIFEDDIQHTVDNMVKIFKPPRGSRSVIISTALNTFDQGPKLNPPDRGLK